MEKQKEQISELEQSYFDLNPSGYSNLERKERLDVFKRYINQQIAEFLGYQADQKLDYKEELSYFLDCHVNNIGDPFTNGNFTVNSKVMERAVLDYFAALWHAKVPHDPKDVDSYWGYVLTMGSSEGNIYGLWNARDYLAGRKLIVDDNPKKKVSEKYLVPRISNNNSYAYTPVAFFSEDTHYSIIKFMRVLQIPTFNEIGEKYFPGQNPISADGEWNESEVPSAGGKNGPGSIDIDKLCALVEFFAEKGFPILVSCNYGSTFKGAYDDVQKIGQRLMPIFEKYGLIDRTVEYADHSFDKRNGYWIHVDGALGASYAPFLKMAQEDKQNFDIPSTPEFDFKLDWVNSIVMSGHKWPGAPWPCGLFMTKVKYQLFPPDDPEYIGSPDTTFAGSRNGFSAIILWDFFAKHSYEDLTKRALRCEQLASFAERQLHGLQKSLPHIDLWIARTPASLTIRFRKPNDEIVFKYSLSCETLEVEGEAREYAHIFMMNSVDEGLILRFISDLQSKDAFPQKTNTSRLIHGKGLGWR